MAKFCHCPEYVFFTWCQNIVCSNQRIQCCSVILMHGCMSMLSSNSMVPSVCRWLVIIEISPCYQVCGFGVAARLKGQFTFFSMVRFFYLYSIYIYFNLRFLFLISKNVKKKMSIFPSQGLQSKHFSTLHSRLNAEIRNVQMPTGGCAFYFTVCLI